MPTTSCLFDLQLYPGAVFALTFGFIQCVVGAAQQQAGIVTGLVLSDADAGRYLNYRIG